jgi:hypothetical protein
MLIFNGNNDEIGRRGVVFWAQDRNIVEFAVNYQTLPAEPFHAIPPSHKGDATGIHVIQHTGIDRPHSPCSNNGNFLNVWFHSFHKFRLRLL